MASFSGVDALSPRPYRDAYMYLWRWKRTIPWQESRHADVRRCQSEQLLAGIDVYAYPYRL